MMNHRSGKPFTDRRDHYQEVTTRIVAALEAGTRPWRQPWIDGAPGMPVNGATGRRYHGINVVILATTAFALGGDPRFCSYKQAADRGWQVRKGERGTTVFFFKQLPVVDRDAASDSEDRTRAVPMLRSYSVFNGSQIDGIPAYIAPNLTQAPWRRPEATQTILANSGARLRIGGEEAFYSPTIDFVQMPPEAYFSNACSWSSVFLHELGHWSGSAHRLDRDLTGRCGSVKYAQEELRAELASVLIGAEMGLPCDIPNHASYIKVWTEVLKRDKREIFRAASDAQKIADYLLGFHPDYALATADAGDSFEDDAAASTRSDATQAA